MARGVAASTVVSPNGNTLLILTSGYNRVFQVPFPLFDPMLSNEYVFVYDITVERPSFSRPYQFRTPTTGSCGT